MSVVSQVPKVYAALLALHQATLAGSPVTVIDGEPTEGQPTDFLAFGHASGDQAAVVNRRAVSTYGSAPSQETIDVVSRIVAWQGDTNLAACRARAYSYIDALVDALTAAMTLPDSDGNPTCLSAYLAETADTAMQTPKGALLQLDYTIQVRVSTSY